MNTFRTARQPGLPPDADHASERISYGFMDSRAFGLGVVERVQRSTAAVPRSHVAFGELGGSVTTLIRQPYPSAWEHALASFLARPEMRT